MSEVDRRKWDEKHASAAAGGVPEPPQWLADHLVLLRRGRAIEVACGLGGAAVHLAQHGWSVTGVDISEVALSAATRFAAARGVTVNWVVADLDEFQFPANHFDLITVFDFLDRDRLPAALVRALRPAGTLVFETFSAEQLCRSDNHLKNPAHALGPGELLRLFSGLRVRCYREVTLPDRAVASLVAERQAEVIGNR